MRTRRRNASHERGDPDEFCRVEFPNSTGGIDLNVSVYEIPAEKNGEVRRAATRIWAEHSGSFLDRPLSRVHLRVDDLGGTLRYDPGTTSFVFSRHQHRTLAFADEDEVRSFAARLLADYSARTIAVTREDVVAYALQKVSSQDREWTELLATERAIHWRKAIDRSRATG